ncbi:MAG: tetratricopeptide repeat protein, partial [Bacteroidota bacterium]
MRTQLYFTLLCLVLGLCMAQAQVTEKITQLRASLEQNPQDSVKVTIMSDLCWYYRSVSMDSAFHFGNEALSLSKRINFEKGMAQAYNDLGILHYTQGAYPSALDHYRKSLKQREKLMDSAGIAGLYNKMGLVYQNTFKMDSALYYATQALKIYEAQGNLRNTIIMRNNRANIHRNLKQFDRALNEHLEIEELLKDTQEYLLLTRAYNNIGNTYLDKKDTLKASAYYKKGIALAQQQDLIKELATLYNNYGSILQGDKDYLGAVDNFRKALAIRDSIGDKMGVASSAINLGTSYLRLGQVDRAFTYLRRGTRLSESLNAQDQMADGYDKLISYFALKGKSDSVLYYQDRYRMVNDSIFSSRVTREVAEIQEKYDAEKREKQILEQRALIAEKDLEVRKKNTLLYGSFGLALVLGLLGYLFYNQQKLKNRQLKKEGELKTALAKIETQNKLQEQRLRISRDLHDNIGSQ